MELDFIRWLRQHVPTHPQAPLGLSDDAAILRLSGGATVIATIDTLTDGVDFRVETDDPRRIGRQALGANLSDLAAMAARPLSAIVSLALPRNSPAMNDSLKLAIGIYEGLLPLAEEYGVAIAGGDTNTFDGPLAISVAAFGEPTGSGPLLRSGGKPGDWLLVTGSLGGSLLGHMFDFTPRVREAIALHTKYELHAATDISDGLSLDASRMASESGCGAVIHVDAVPVSPDAVTLAEQEKATNVHHASLMHAISDGQDFELLIAAAPNVAQAILNDQPVECPITRVGELIAEPGLWQRNSAGVRQSLEPTGWKHQ